MTSATLTLTDRNGKLDMHVEYEGGLDERCPSHEHMLLLVATLDQMADPIGEPVHIISTPESTQMQSIQPAAVPLLRRNADGQVIGWEMGEG